MIYLIGYCEVLCNAMSHLTISLCVIPTRQWMTNHRTDIVAEEEE